MLEAFVRAVDRLNLAVGYVVAFMTFGTAFVCFATVYLRYTMQISFTWLRDAYVYQHMLVILLGAGYTLMVNGFVRVDVLYGRMSVRGKAWVDLLGTFLFMGPFLVGTWIYSWTFVAQSWAIMERSPQSDGLPGLFLVKTALLVFVVLVGLQALAVAARSVLILRGREEFALRQAEVH